MLNTLMCALFLINACLLTLILDNIFTPFLKGSVIKTLFISFELRTLSTLYLNQIKSQLQICNSLLKEVDLPGAVDH